MMLPLLAALPLSPPSDAVTNEAELRVVTDTGEQLLLSVRNDERQYRRTFSAECIAKCVKPLHYAEEISDTPLGLFKRSDWDNLIYSTWAGGSAYRVRVWSVTDDGVQSLFEESSRGMPGFITDKSGRQIIRTYERPHDAVGRDTSLNSQVVLWRLENGHFVRLNRRGR